MSGVNILLLFVAVLVAAAACYWVVQYAANKKLRERVRNQFGNPPKIVHGFTLGKLYWQAMLENEAPQQYIDELTWADLDMHNVYLALNTCFSALGDAELYCALRRPLENPDTALAPLEALMDALAQNPTLRENVQVQLGRLGRGGAEGLARLGYHPEKLREHAVWRFYLLGALPLLCLAILPFSVQWAVVALVGAAIFNFAVYQVVRGSREGGVQSVAYLVSQLNYAKRLAAMLAKPAPEAAARLRAAAKPFGFLSRSYLPLYIDNACTTIGLPNPMAMLQIPLLSYCKITRKIEDKGPEIRELYAALGSVDVAAALVSYRASLPLWCRPQFRAQPGISAQSLYHPLLAEPVANTAELPGDALFTGSNASGKSTFIKAIAVNNILAQTVATCTAGGYTIQPGLVATSMAVADSIVDGDSYFIAEIKSLRRLVDMAESGRPATLFIDEILKGTNTVERVAAAAAVLRYLHGTQCQCFAATHDLELTELLADGFENYHFREQIVEGRVEFDYVLYRGPATTRNAIRLLETMGFPPLITTTAQATATHFEATGSWQLP